MGIRKVYCLFFICLIICLLAESVFATDSVNTDFESLELIAIDSNAKQQSWQSLEFREIPIDEATNSNIVSFDVSDQGEILAALDNQQLFVFNDQAQLVKVFRFNITGSYYVFWERGNIALYGIRSNRIIVISKNGTLIDVFELDTDSVKNSHFSYNISMKTNETLGEDLYYVEKPRGIIGFFSGYKYDKLMHKAASGEESIIYSIAEGNKPISIPIALLGFLLLITIISTIIVGGVIAPKIKQRRPK